MSIRYVDQNADLVGTVAGPFNIGAGNDQLQITIDGGSVQNITLPHSAMESAAALAAYLNSVLVDATAYTCQTSYARIRTTSANGATSTILIGAPANNCNALLGFTAGTYIGHSRVNTTFVGATKQNIIDNMESILNGVGWTTISGHGTTNLLLQSPITPPGEDLQIRMRFKDNSTNCVSASIEDVSGTYVGVNANNCGGLLLPGAAKVFRVIANKYWFCVFTVRPTPSREFICGGTGLLPAFLQGLITRCGFVWGNSQGDTDATVRSSPRTCLDSHGAGSYTEPNTELLVNASIWSYNGGPNSWAAGQPEFLGMTGAKDGVSAYLWYDGSAMIYDPILAWADSAYDGLTNCKIQLCDAFISTDSVTGDTVVATSDGHNALAITDSNVGAAAGFMRGTLFMIVP